MRASPLSNVTGFILIVLGLISVIYPAYSSVSLEAFFGAIFLVSGIFHTFAVYEIRERDDYIWNLGIGILYIIAGIFMLGNPVMGLVAITFFLIILFMAQGGLQILVSLRQRASSEKWYWTFISGLSNLAIGLILYMYFPLSVKFGIGLLVGINLLLFGFSILLVNRIVGNQ